MLSSTFNFQNFNEIMPCIYSRFMEKEARQWREIYKALQLLEYLVKHGSERVVDDARSHISTIKMLRNFHYIDDKGKDEGVNGEHNVNSIQDDTVSLCYGALVKSVTALKNSSSSSRM